jgi:toxin YoeB
MSSRQRVVSYTLIVDPNFLEDLQWWVETQPRVATRVLELVDDLRKTPFTGIGKPEHLKYLPGKPWSRRITEEHRLAYRVDAGCIYLLQCRYHYK